MICVDTHRIFGVIPQHGGFPERIGEGQIHIQQRIFVEIHRESDFAVPIGHAVDCVEDTTHDKHLSNFMVV